MNGSQCATYHLRLTASEGVHKGLVESCMGPLLPPAHSLIQSDSRRWGKIAHRCARTGHLQVYGSVHWVDQRSKSCCLDIVHCTGKLGMAETLVHLLAEGHFARGSSRKKHRKTSNWQPFPSLLIPLGFQWNSISWNIGPRVRSCPYKGNIGFLVGTASPYLQHRQRGLVCIDLLA